MPTTPRTLATFKRATNLGLAAKPIAEHGIFADLRAVCLLLCQH